MRVNTIVAVLVILFFCMPTGLFSQSAGKQSESFRIEARVTGFQDGTKFYLDTWASPVKKLFDTASAIGGRFVLKGNYAGLQPPIRVCLRTKDYSSYFVFWLEGEQLTFTASKEQFEYAAVSGSVTEYIESIYRQSVLDIKKELVNLSQLIRNGNRTDTAYLLAKSDSLEKVINTVKKPWFITSYPNTIISAILLAECSKRIPKEETIRLYNGLSDPVKNSNDGLKVKRFIELNKEIKIGDVFTDITQPNLNNQRVSLSGSKGKYILLEFWSSYCGPCIRENPALVKMYERFKEKGFEIYAVSLDSDKAGWTKAINKDQLPWINVSELNGYDNSAAIIYGIYELPSNYLIDPSGKIIAKNLRGKVLEDKLAELLKDNTK